MTSILVKPAAGRVVRAPDGTIIPPEGLHLVRDLYIDRRIADGDLAVVEEPASEDVGEGHGTGQAGDAGAGKNRKKGTDA